VAKRGKLEQWEKPKPSPSSPEKNKEGAARRLNDSGFFQKRYHKKGDLTGGVFRPQKIGGRVPGD